MEEFCVVSVPGLLVHQIDLYNYIVGSITLSQERLDKLLCSLENIKIVLKYGYLAQPELFNRLMKYLVKIKNFYKYFDFNESGHCKTFLRIISLHHLAPELGVGACYILGKQIKLDWTFIHSNKNSLVPGNISNLAKYIPTEKNNPIYFDILVEETGWTQRMIRKKLGEIKDTKHFPKRLMDKNKIKDIALNDCSLQFIIKNYETLKKYKKIGFPEISVNKDFWKNMNVIIYFDSIEKTEELKILEYIKNNFIKNNILVTDISPICGVQAKNSKWDKDEDIMDLISNLDQNPKLGFASNAKPTDFGLNQNPKFIFTNKKLNNLNKLFSIIVEANPQPVFNFNLWEISLNKKITYPVMKDQILFLQGFSTTALKNIFNGLFPVL